MEPLLNCNSYIVFLVVWHSSLGVEYKINWQRSHSPVVLQFLDRINIPKNYRFDVLGVRIYPQAIPLRSCHHLRFICV